jgi:hypothetical protein
MSPAQRSGITASMVTAAMPGLDALQVDDRGSLLARAHAGNSAPRWFASRGRAP